MKFFKFKLGMVVKSGPIQLSQADILSFANQFDPQWFYTNPERAPQGG